MILNMITPTLMEREGFFQSAIDFFKSIIEIVDNIIHSITMAFNFIISIERLPQLIVAYLPSFVSAMVLIVVGICVINYIVGR